MNNSRRFIVHIPIPSNSGAFWARRFTDFTEADQAARERQGMLYELEEGHTDLDIDDDNQIIGGRLIQDYSSLTGE